MSITFLIPTHNRPQLLERCIKSILNQINLKSINIIIKVADSSLNQDSQDILEKLETPDNITLEYIKNINPVHPIENWLVLMNNNDSQYIKFLCDDDWLKPNYISAVLPLLNNNNYDCLISNIDVHFPNKTTLINYYKMKDTIFCKNEFIDSIIFNNIPIPYTQSAAIMKTEYLNEAFNFSLKNKDCTNNLLGEDIIHNYHGLFENKIVYLSAQSLVNSWAGNDSLTLNTPSEEIFYCNILSLLLLIEEYDVKLTNLQKEYIEHYLFINKVRGFFKGYKYLNNSNLKAKIKPRIIISNLKNTF